MLSYKPDFEQAQTYWDSFWNHEIIDRPLCAIHAPKDPDAPPPAPLRVIGVDEPFEKAFRVFDEHLEKSAFLGDMIPNFRCNLGPDQFAGFLGAPIVVSPDGTTSWSEKIVEDWADVMPLKIDPANPCWNRLIEYHQAAEKHFARRCLLAGLDLHSNIDALEGLRGAEKLMYDLIDQPDLMHEAMKQVRAAFPVVFEEFQKYGNKTELGTTAWLFAYSRQRYSPIQSDYIALLNPPMFREFVLPALEEEANYLDHSVFHLDGQDALKHLDDILAIDAIDCIQWVPGAGKPRQKEWPEVLQKIQAAGKALWLSVFPEEVKEIHHLYKPELMCYIVSARSIEEGEDLLDWLVKNT